MGIGPSTKETTLHHFRDPLVDELCDDTDIDFAGVIVAGIPQDNVNKYFTGDRIGAWVVGISFVGVQGAFVVTNQYMNNIVDINKSAEGVETNVVGENNLVRSDAKKAKAILKLKMRSVER